MKKIHESASRRARRDVQRAAGRRVPDRRRAADASGHRRRLVRPPRDPAARPHARPAARLGRPARACGRGRRRLRQVRDPCALAGNPRVPGRRRARHVGPDPGDRALHRAEQSAAFQSPAGAPRARLGDDRRAGRVDRRAHHASARARRESERDAASGCGRVSASASAIASAERGRAELRGEARAVPIAGGAADGI